MMKKFGLIACAVVVLVTAESTTKKHHKKHHHKKHHKKNEKKQLQKEEPKGVEAKGEAPKVASTEAKILDKMKSLESELDKKEAMPAQHVMQTDKIIVNGPLPADFNNLFSQAVAKAVGCKTTDVTVLETNIINTSFLQVRTKDNVIVEIVFKATAKIVSQVKKQAAASDSPLATGALQPFLVAKEGVDDVSQPPSGDTGIDVDTEMPYGELEPFGREDTAHELTDDSIRESDAMVDQMERAEVAEEKRSVFRALTRLRGAAITSFDGVARSQTGNIDEYNKVHKWRKTHPLHHLAAEENNVSKWAFPDGAD